MAYNKALKLKFSPTEHNGQITKQFRRDRPLKCVFKFCLCRVLERRGEAELLVSVPTIAPRRNALYD